MCHPQSVPLEVQAAQQLAQTGAQATASGMRRVDMSTLVHQAGTAMPTLLTPATVRTLPTGSALGAHPPRDNSFRSVCFDPASCLYLLCWAWQAAQAPAPAPAPTALPTLTRMPVAAAPAFPAAPAPAAPVAFIAPSVLDVRLAPSWLRSFSSACLHVRRSIRPFRRICACTRLGKRF